MVTRSNKITALILSTVMVLGVFVPGTDLAYAKSKKTKAPAKVKGVKITVKANKMTIKWKKAKRTKKYQVYVKRNSGKWKKVKTLKKRRYTYKAKNNGKFTFRVRALNKGKKGKFSKKVSKKISCIPAIKVNKTRVTVEQGKSFTIKVTGYAASSASWTFDSEYLSANTNTGASKKFKGKTIGTSSVAVTDKKGNNEQLVEVTVKEKAPEPENKKFALDCEQNITVTEGEEFTLKVKGESNIIRYTLWDYDKTYLKMTSYNSQGASVSFLAFCAGTTKVIADSQEGITYTINITIEPENIDKSVSVSIFNPNNYPIYSSYSIMPVHVKTSYWTEKNSSIHFCKTDLNIREGEKFDNSKETAYRGPGSSWYYQDVKYIHLEDEMPIDHAISDGYLISAIVDDPGVYTIVVVRNDNQQIIHVSEPINIADGETKYQECVEELISDSEITDDMTLRQKCDAMDDYLMYGDWRYPYKTNFSTESLCTKVRYKKRMYYAHFIVDTINHGILQKVSDSGTGGNYREKGTTSADLFCAAAEKLGAEVVSYKTHDIRLKIDGEEVTFCCCPQKTLVCDATIMPFVL